MNLIYYNCKINLLPPLPEIVILIRRIEWLVGPLLHVRAQPHFRMNGAVISKVVVISFFSCSFFAMLLVDRP